MTRADASHFASRAGCRVAADDRNPRNPGPTRSGVNGSNRDERTPACCRSERSGTLSVNRPDGGVGRFCSRAIPCASNRFYSPHHFRISDLRQRPWLMASGMLRRKRPALKRHAHDARRSCRRGIARISGGCATGRSRQSGEDHAYARSIAMSEGGMGPVHLYRARSEDRRGGRGGVRSAHRRHAGAMAAGGSARPLPHTAALGIRMKWGTGCGVRVPHLPHWPGALA